MDYGTTTPQERADDRYDAAQEEVTAALNAADLFDELTESECAELVRAALRGEATKIPAHAAERIINRQTGELLAEASRLARVSPLRVVLWDEVSA